MNDHARRSEVLGGNVIRVGPEFAAEAVGIVREAAAWALRRGVDVWADAELRERDFLAGGATGRRRRFSVRGI